MGTEYRITVIKNNSVDDALLEASVVAAMNTVNQSMSNYISDSEISQFNRARAYQPQTLSADFTDVVFEALNISRMSNGAFDITLAKAIDAWGFGPDGEITAQPSSIELERLRATVGYEKLVLKGRSLSKTIDAVELNVSAIAKGYAVDKVAQVLDENGIDNYLINIGGELRASGQSGDKQLWKVGIEKPHILGGIQEIAQLDNVAIATSGDYRNYLIIDGQQFSHMIDPETLIPIYHKLALVSVISQRASTADALATAMMAMGEKRAWEFAQNNDLAAYMVIRGDSEQDFQIRSTREFDRYLQ